MEVRIKDVPNLARALERVILVSGQSNSPMEFSITSGKLALSSETELGRVHETMDVETVEYAETSLWYNPKYLLDATGVIKGEAVIYISAKGMMLLTAENYCFIIAPISKPKKTAITEKAAA
jgi:DNA polymerase III sliding clamp (beta) subunit (PCNA family)